MWFVNGLCVLPPACVARQDKKGGGGGGGASSAAGGGAGVSGAPVKTKEESIAEKKHELEKRLQDVSGQLGSNTTTAVAASAASTATSAVPSTNTTSPTKKTPKKGMDTLLLFSS